MDNSFIQSQHPVVEELLTNKYFGDTLLVCANGHLTNNKLAVGLLFPCLLISDIFALPIENVLLVPDYTMEEIGREFEKLILGGSFQPKPENNPTNTSSQSSSSSAEQSPEAESNSTSGRQDETMSLGQAAAVVPDDARSPNDQEETSSEDATSSQVPQLCAQVPQLCPEDSSPQINHNDSESPPVLEQIPTEYRQQQITSAPPLQTMLPSSNVQTVQNVHSVTGINTVGNIQSMHPSVSVQNIQPIVTVQTGLSPAQGVHTAGTIQGTPGSVQGVHTGGSVQGVHTVNNVQEVHTAGSVQGVHSAGGVQGVHLPINGPVYMTPLQKPDNSRQAQPYQSPYHTPTLYQPSNQVHQSPLHIHQSPVHMHQSPVHLHQSPHHQPVHTVQQSLGVPVYTTQQYSTGGLPTTLQYSTNSNSTALVANNNATAVVFSPQPYTNTTLQYQELGNVQPLTSLQAPSIVQSTSSQLLPGSGQLLSNSGQMLPGSSQPLASGSGTTYTDLNYQQTSSISGEEYHDTSIPDEDSDRENDNFVIYREPKINEVTMGNGYSESCDEITNPLKLDDDDSIVFYLNEQEASSSESSNAYQPSTSDSTSIQTSPTKKKSVTFKEPVKAVRSKSRRRSKKELLRIEEYEDTDVAMIQNLKDKDTSADSVNEDNESPIVEDRKPGRPKTKPPNPNKRPRPEGEITRFKRVSAVNVDKGKYKCTECEKVLSCQGSLNRHMLVHSDGKPFKCKYCDKSFREQSKKSVHERVHTGSKPFPCKICDQSFRTATQRRVHLFRHTKESEWKCGTCNQAFAQKFHLKRHKEKRKH